MLATTYDDLESWIHTLSKIEKGSSFASPRFLKPYHLASLANKLRMIEAKNLTLPAKITSYARTMKLWDILDLETPVETNIGHPSGSYHPLVLLNNSNMIDITAANLLTFFRAVCTDDVTLNAVDTMLKELIDNCYSHSAVEDEKYGLICAQVWRAGNKAQITISDTGVGIRNSLSENVDYIETLKTTNSCEFATNYGVTSKPGKGHAGYGLAVARGLIQQNHGTLFVRSGNECFQLHEGECNSFHTDNHLDGTLIVIEWNLNVQMDISALYREWPQIEGMNDDDFDF